MARSSVFAPLIVVLLLAACVPPPPQPVPPAATSVATPIATPAPTAVPTVTAATMPPATTTVAAAPGPSITASASPSTAALEPAGAPDTATPPTPTPSATLASAAASSAAPAAQASPACPVPGAPAGWLSYTNPAGFSICYPPTWSVAALPDQNNGALHGVVFTGPGGGVQLYWGTGFGGACPQGYGTIQVAQGELPVCYTKNADGTENWEQIYKDLGNGVTFAARGYTTNAAPESREVILAMFSTLTFAAPVPATGPAAAQAAPQATALPTGTPTPEWQVETLLVAPGQPGRLYALVKNNPGPLWAFPASGVRLMVSVDYAQSWQPFSGGLPVPPECMYNVNLDYATSDALYASTCQGLYVWGGGAWTLRSPQLTNVVAVVYGQPNIVWAAEPRKSVIRSDDGGRTWHDASSGLIQFGGISNLGIDPVDPNTLFAIIRPEYAGSYLRRGTASGQWQTMPAPSNNATIDTGMAIDGGSGALYVTTQVAPIALWRSANPATPNMDDIRWEQVHDFGGDVQVSLLASGWGPQGTAFYANIATVTHLADGGGNVSVPVLHRSVDGGQTWQALATP